MLDTYIVSVKLSSDAMPDSQGLHARTLAQRLPKFVDTKNLAIIEIDNAGVVNFSSDFCSELNISPEVTNVELNKEHSSDYYFDYFELQNAIEALLDKGNRTILVVSKTNINSPVPDIRLGTYQNSIKPITFMPLYLYI